MSQPSFKVPKNLRPIVRAAIRQGWTVSYTGKHIKMTSPSGDWAVPIPGSGTTSMNLTKHITAQLRKHGVEF